MQKLLILIIAILGMTFNSKASIYKLDAKSIETKFAAAQALDITTLNMNMLTQNTMLKEDVSRITAGVLGIFCGNFGIHRFYMGHTNAGIVYLVVGVFTGTAVSTIAGVIDGVLYLVATDEEFTSKYLHNDKIIQWL